MWTVAEAKSSFIKTAVRKTYQKKWLPTVAWAQAMEQVTNKEYSPINTLSNGKESGLAMFSSHDRPRRNGRAVPSSTS
jgi:hypothetical protein